QDGRPYYRPRAGRRRPRRPDHRDRDAGKSGGGARILHRPLSEADSRARPETDRSAFGGSGKTRLTDFSDIAVKLFTFPARNITINGSALLLSKEERI